MRFAWYLSLAFLATVALPSQVALAGMGSSFLMLSEVARMRFQTISFFLMGLLLCTWGVRFLWNYVQRDFTSLPRLTFRMAGVLVLIWGLLSIVVLTMISGARELMTPGAWKTQGVTYRLAADVEKNTAPGAMDPAIDGLLETRRRRLEQLRAVLWNYAASHDDQFPPKQFGDSIAPQEWQLPASEGMPYSYRTGLAKEKSDAVLVLEPRIYGNDQFVLLANGEIVRMAPDKLRQALDVHAKPAASPDVKGKP